jgi:hypothetical protein
MCWTLFQCSQSPSWKSTFFEIKDDNGRLVEKYGNENSPDNDVNFHSFYFYDDNGRLVKKRTFYDLDSTYVVKDSLDYIDLLYSYDETGNQEKEIRTTKGYDTSGNIVARDTTYIKHLKTNKIIYPEKMNDIHGAAANDTSTSY